LIVLGITINLNAQTPPPPHGGNGNPIENGNTPVGGGLLILVVLGAGYGAKKVYDFSRR